MPFHHLIRNGLLVPRSNIYQYQLTHPKPVLHCIFSKTSPHFDRTCNLTNQGCQQRAAMSTMCTGQSNPSHLYDKSEKLFSPSMKKSQPCMKFSSSTYYCNKLSKVKGNGSGSKPFDFLSLRSLISTPPPYLLYGISGLIPFTSVPVYMFMTSTYYPLLAHAQLVYGACILSFLGGVSWGNELNTPEISTLKSLGYSISLPLIGWMGVLAYPSIIAFPIMISGISLAGYTDTQIQNYSQWFKNLRFLLSTLVLSSLVTTFVFSLVYQDSDSKKSLE